jgi:GAG-pre-integrase domain
VILSYEEDQCLYVEGHQGVEWIVDTGACYHVTPNKEFFMMGNISHSCIAGIADIYLQIDMSCRLILKDVWHIPDLRLNLISGNVLDKDGFKHYLEGGEWKLSKGSMVVAKGKSWNSLYRTHAKVLKNGLNAVQTGNSVNLWHQRLGHMSEKGLQILASKSHILSTKDEVLDTCDYCLFGKQHRVSFSQISERKHNLLA